jgi:hypothetical protein
MKALEGKSFKWKINEIFTFRCSYLYLQFSISLSLYLHLTLLPVPDTTYKHFTEQFNLILAIGLETFCCFGDAKRRENKAMATSDTPALKSNFFINNINVMIFFRSRVVFHHLQCEKKKQGKCPTND